MSLFKHDHHEHHDHHHHHDHHGHHGHSHSHAGCNHDHKHEEVKGEPKPVHISSDINNDKFFAGYKKFEGIKEIKDTSQKKLVMSHSEGSTVDVGALDYIVLQPGKPDKLLISACNTSLKGDLNAATVVNFIKGEDHIELRCSKKKLTLDDVTTSHTHHEGQVVTLLKIDGGKGLAAVSFLGDHPELMQSMSIEALQPCHH